MASGFLSLGAGSQTIAAQANLNSTSGTAWSLEIGPVADYSFAGGQTVGLSYLYIGNGDYSTIVNPLLANVSLTADSTGAYPLTNVGFGLLNFSSDIPSQGFF